MITVNKQEHEWHDGMTIQSLLEEKNFTFPRIVVKVNGKLIKKQQYSSYTIEDGDRIDAIHMIGGG
jgi:thiamine biosynthesis protein ThiS